MRRIETSAQALTPLDPWSWQEAKAHMAHGITLSVGIDGALARLRQTDAAFKAFIRAGAHEPTYAAQIDMFGLALDDLKVSGRALERSGKALEVFTDSERLASELRAMAANAPTIAERDKAYAAALDSPA